MSTQCTDAWYGSLPQRVGLSLLRRGIFSKPFFAAALGTVVYTYFFAGHVNIGGIDVNLRSGWELAAYDLKMAFVAIFIAGLGKTIRTREERFIQKDRDRKAEQLLNAILEQKVSTYFLYLRPFILTRRMVVSNPAYSSLGISPSYYSQAKTTDLETLLESALRPSGPLIGLGQPGEHIGAGRIKVEDAKWKLPFEALARGAHRIFVIPSHRTGTKWEIEWLQQQAYLAKCVFVMPPALLSRGIRMEKLWAEAAEKLHELGIILPPYVKAGMLFKLQSDGAVAVMRPLKKIKDLGAAISELAL